MPGSPAAPFPAAVLLAAALAVARGIEVQDAGRHSASCAARPLAARPVRTAPVLVQAAVRLRTLEPPVSEGSARPQSPRAAPSSCCAHFGEWPDLNEPNVTCGTCTALVLARPHGGRCDRYCESFGHACAGAAEELDEGCGVKFAARCDEEIPGTSDMLCACRLPGSPGSCSFPLAPPAGHAPSTSPAPSPATLGGFEALDGGDDRACRGQDPADSSEQYYTLEHAASLEACQALCRGEPRCRGVEFASGSGRCEVWTRQGGIGATSAVAGYACWRYMPPAGPTAPVGDSFAPVDGGSDRACRGARADDNAASHYEVRRATVLAGCEALCLAEPTCRGVEYRGSDGRCELWTRQGGIGASAPVAGYTCLRRGALASSTAELQTTTITSTPQGTTSTSTPAAPTTTAGTTPATSTLGEACHTAVAGEPCYTHVSWALQHGLRLHPEWYPGLEPSATFQEVQALLHSTGSHDGVCPASCEGGEPGPAPGPTSGPLPASFWRVVSYNVWWWNAPGGNYDQQTGMHQALRNFGEQRVALLGVQECDGGWDWLKRLAGPSVDYLRPFAGTKQLCGSYDPEVFEAVADGVVYVWSFRHLQWVRLRERATGRMVVFVNVHWHHTGGPSIKVQEAANTKQAIMDCAEPGDVVVVTGDFNVFDDALKAEMNSNFLALGLQPFGHSTIFGGVDYVWFSHTPREESACQQVSDEPRGSDHDPVLCLLNATSSSYDDTGSTPLPGEWPWRIA